MWPERVVCILGMHRSGTSCLTGSLQACGLALGQHSTWNPHNRRGNRENDAVVALHERILADNGGSWDCPPHQVIWTDSHRREAESLLAAHGDLPQWGFKDPRTLLVLEGWHALLGPRLVPVGIFRHPLSVSESLHRRGEFPRERAQGLWRHYNRLLLRALHRLSMPLLCFDWPEAVFHRRLERLAGELGLAACPEQAPFYSDALHSHRHDGLRRLPLASRYLYWRLRRAADRQTAD